MQGAPNQTHSLMKWIDAAICTMWTKAGEFLDSVSKWHTYAELTQDRANALGKGRIISMSV